MNFYDYPTAFNESRKNSADVDLFDSGFPNYRAFYQKGIGDALDRRHEIIAHEGKHSWQRLTQRLAAEAAYYQMDRPYYMIHPQIVETFSNAKTDNIPFRSYIVPATSFVLRFADSPLNEFHVSRDERIQSILVCALSSVLPKECQDPKLKSALFLSLDTGDPNSSHTNISVPIHSWDETIENALDGMEVRGVDYQSDYAIRCVRLALSIGFLLKTDNNLVEPHVLNKDIREYYKSTDQKRKQELARKAFKRRSREGHKVGFPREHNFPISSPPLQGCNSGSSGERELTFAHLRSGHWHLVRHGKNHSESKVMWFFPTVVRTDLPFRPPK